MSINLKQYDATEEARLVSLADAKEKERVVVASRIQEMIDDGESKSWDNDQHLSFRQLKEKHDWLRSEIGRINSDVEAMQITKPVENAAKMNRDDGLLRWLKGGDAALDSHERVDQDKMAVEMSLGGGRRYIDPIFKAAVTPAGNSNVLDETVVQDVVQGLHQFGGAIQCATVAMTADGLVIKYPLYDDYSGGNPRAVQVPTGNAAAQQATAQTEGALSGFDQVELSAYVRNTLYLDISQFFNEDVRWNVGSFVRNVLMRRMGYQIENELTTGGIATLDNVATYPAPTANMPTGFMARATDTNYTSPSGSKTVLRWEDLNNLIHSVDSAYLMGEVGLYGFSHKMGKIGFMTSWQFLGEIKNLVDTQNRPLVIPSIQTGTLDTLLGYPVFINHQIPHKNFGAQHNRPIYFGNWGYFCARFAGQGFAIEEFYDSNVAPSNARRYMGRLRFDSEYIGTLDNNKGAAIRCLKRNIA